MNRMKNINFIRLTFLLVIFSLVSTVQGSVYDHKTERPVLARVEVEGMLNDLGLPVHAHLKDAVGEEYALVIAPKARLDQARVTYRILDKNTKGANYFIITRFPSDMQVETDQLHNVLLADGKQVIIRSNFKRVESLVESGFDVQRLDHTPMVLDKVDTYRQPDASLLSVTYDSNIAQMINSVSQSTLTTYTNNLSGENPVYIGGSNYTIVSRHTSSGTPISKATQYVLEFLQSQGLTAWYHNWSSSGYSGRNVIGEKTGSTQANEIVLITAHLDCMPSGSTSYGADDNATGSAAVMMCAKNLKSYQFNRTVRFVFFTGEEQGLLGSNAYANLIYQNGDNIVAVYNMDMLGYDAIGGPYLRLHTRYTSNPGYQGDLLIANTFVDVVNTYGISGLSPLIDKDNESRSDHASFWNKGYPGILGIEDNDNDFTPYYHTTSDRVSTLNTTYFTNFVKASVGTAAHLAILGGAQPVTFQCVADTFVRQDQPDTNFGTSTLLRSRGSATGAGINPFLKFTVSGVTGPIQSVKLRIKTQSAFPACVVYHMIDNTWQEYTLTWNTRKMGYYSSKNVGALSANVWYEFDVKSFVTGNGTYTFYLAASDVAGQAFYSRESSTKPTLIVTY